MQIVTSPDPLLRQRCEECSERDRSVKRLAHQMARTMYKNNGCGLAAPQVGMLKRIVVIDCDVDSDAQNPVFLINPSIVETSGENVTEPEGCLSFPGISVPVTRPAFARVEYRDLDGNACTIEGDGLLGRCLQHEINHLDGITLFESCNPVDRIKALHDYDAALAAGAKPGETSIGE